MARTSATISVGANTRQLERDIQSALSRDFKFKGFNEKAFTQPLGRISGAANEFQKSLDASNARVIAFGASAGLIFTVEKAFTSLVKSTIDVQKSLTDINVILNVSTKTLDQFGSSLFDIAKNTGQTFDAVAQAATELSRQGLGLEETLKRTQDALILTRLSGLDTVSSVEALTAAINSFSKAGLDSTIIINKLANVDAAFAVSSGDLAEAIKRVGSSASDAGVDFDELLAIVTSVQQTTARGGAVIGNSLKTIFTRIQRTDTLDQLEQIGIRVRDLEGNTLPAIQVLSNLSNTFNTLADAQKAQVAETVGGVFQINILKAALADLGKEYSVYDRALQTASNSTDQAIQRNEALNQTLSALINQTFQNLTKLSASVGEISLGPTFKGTLELLNKGLESLSTDSETVGGKIGKGILEGIGTFISGPGVILLTAVFGKLLLNLGKFASQSLQTLLSVNTQAEQRAQIQAKINQVLAQEPALVAAIYNKQISVLELENRILGIIKLQTLERERAAAISTSIAGNLVARGVTSKGGSLKVKSGGFIPNFSAQEIYGALAGGYIPGNIQKMNIPGQGNITYNSAETVKNFPGMTQPAIMPPQGSKAGKNYKKQFSSAHGFNPYASEGFVPNFAISPFQRAQKLFTEARSSKLDIEDLIIKRNYVITPEVRKEIEGIKTDPKKTAQTKGEVVTYNASKLGIVGVAGRRGTVDAQTKFNTLGYTKDPRSVKFLGIQARTLEDLKNSTIKDKSSFSTKINELFYNPLAQLANDVFGPLSPDPKFKSVLLSNTRKPGVNLFPAGAEGSIFEAAVNLGTKRGGSLEKAFDQNASQKPFDFEEASPPATAFNSKFGFTPAVLRADAKRTISSEQAREIIDKAYRDPITRSDPKLPKPRIAASGFIPNFTALDNAIGREVAAGTSTSRIRIGKDSRLTSSANPLGLGVYNTKDEPRGLGQGIERYGSKAKMAGAAAGFIPNFAGLSFNPGSLGALDISTASREVGAEFGKILAKLRTQEITLDQANANLKKLSSTYGLAADSQNRFNQILQSRTSQYAASTKGITISIDKAKTNFEKLSNAGLALSLVLPIALQTVSQFNQGNKKLQVGIDAFSTFLSLTAAGATLGPAGAVGGAAAGAGLGLYQYFEGLKGLDLDKLKNDIQNLQDEFNSTSTSVNQIIPLVEKYKEVQASALPDTQKIEALGNIQDQISSSLSKIGPEFADSLLESIKNQNYDQVGYIINQALSKKAAEVSNLTSQAVLENVKNKEVKDKYTAVGISKAVTGLQTPSGKNILQEFAKSPENKNKINETVKTLEGLLEERAAKEKQINDLLDPQLKKEQEFSARADKKGSLSEKAISLLFGYNKYLDGQNESEKSIVESEKIRAQLSKELNLNLDQFLNAVEPLYQATDESRMEFQKLREKAKDTNLNQEAASAIIKTTTNYLKDIQNTQQKVAALLKSGISTVDQYILAFKNGTLNAKDAQDFYKKTFALQNDPSKMLAKNQNDLNMSVATSILNEDTRNKVIDELTIAEEKLKAKLDSRQINEDQYNRALEGLKDRITLAQRGNMFAEDFRGQRQTNREANALANETKLSDFAGAFFDEFDQTAADSYRQAQLGAKDTANTIKSEFNNAFLSFANGTETASDAFTKMALNISDKIQQLALEFSTNLLFSKLMGTTSNIFGGGGGGGFNLGSLFGFNKGGIVKGYSSGGTVTGGSGTRDDIPAMLSGGEYVIKKSAVSKYGTNFLEMLNNKAVGKFADGGGLENTFENTFLYNDPFRPTAGTMSMDSRLSLQAVTDENNPMNRVRMEREMDFLNYIKYVEDIDAQNRENEKAYWERKFEAEKARLEAWQEETKRRQEMQNQYNDAQKKREQGNWYKFGFGVLGAGASFFKDGGQVKKFAKGGKSEDDVPAMLMDGEFIMRKQAVNLYGKKFFDELNSGRIRKFAEGGGVGSTGSSSYMGDGGTNSTTNNVNVTVNVTKEGATSEDSSSSSDAKDRDSTDKERQETKILAEKVKGQVLKVITEQQRPGGLLYRGR